ncbi:MAG: TonB-dependent receptor plug domain-containing protein, partial [Flavobacteriales bacterium]
SAQCAEDSLDIKMRGQLGEVVISDVIDPLANVTERMDDILLATKKVELIRVQAMPGNLVQNSTRQLFSRTPGVNVWESEGSGAQIGVAVRGLSPNRSWELNVRQDGYDIAADPFGYPEAYYSPPLEAVDEILFVRGAASLQFGPQFGGVIDYKLRQGDTTKRIGLTSMQTIGSYGLFNTYNAIGGQSGKWNYRVSYHHRNGQGWRENAAYAMNHFFSRISFRPTEHFEAAVELTVFRNQLQQPGGHTDSSFNVDPRRSFRSRNWL